jgi:hypothetical protein
VQILACVVLLQLGGHVVVSYQMFQQTEGVNGRTVMFSEGRQKAVFDCLVRSLTLDYRLLREPQLRMEN